jgi:hypothetical protein
MSTPARHMLLAAISQHANYKEKQLVKSGELGACAASPRTSDPLSGFFERNLRSVSRSAMRNRRCFVENVSAAWFVISSS